MGSNRGVRRVWLLAAVVACFAPARAEAYSFGGGTGEPNSPYRIATGTHLVAIGSRPEFLRAHFVLVADIDLTGFTCETALIAPDVELDAWGFQGEAFTGVFDGNGHTITGLAIDGGSTNDHLGLFGWNNGTIRRLRLYGTRISGNSYAGCLAGVNLGTISGCFATGSVEVERPGDYIGGLVGGNGGVVTYCHASADIVCLDDRSEFVGGLVGRNGGYCTGNGDYTEDAVISHCYATGSISAGGWVGGLVGENAHGSVSYCHATGNVSAIRGNVGGLAGSSGWAGEAAVANCFATGKVTGDGAVGGLIGLNGGPVSGCYATGDVNGYGAVGGLLGKNSYSTVSDCYATGAVRGHERVGGLVGISTGMRAVVSNCYATGIVDGNDMVGGLLGERSDAATVKHCFWDIATSGVTNMCGGLYWAGSGDDSYGLPTAELQKAETFGQAGWDLVDETANGTENLWWIDEGQDYPRLVWHYANPIVAVEISTAWDYQAPDADDDADYCFELSVLTDETVERVNFLTPAGNAGEIRRMARRTTPMPGGTRETRWEYDAESCSFAWCYEVNFDSVTGLDDFGDGDYIVETHYEDGRIEESAVWFGIPDTNNPIPQPTQKPVLTSFAHRAVLSSPVAIAWQLCVDPAASLIWIGLDRGSWERNSVLPVGAAGLDNALDLEPGDYRLGLGYEVWYETRRPNGIRILCGKYSESDYEFTVVADAERDETWMGVHQLWSPVYETYFYTIDQAEKDALVQDAAADWQYEGIAYYACNDADEPNVTAVFRFSSKTLGSYFYTTSEAEREFLIATFAGIWSYEGVAFYVFTGSPVHLPSDARPVFRFWSPVYGGHFYTIDTNERDAFIREHPDVWTYEGIVWYAYREPPPAAQADCPQCR